MNSSTNKMTYTRHLELKTPKQWARLIRKKIKPVQLRSWIASICMWNYPRGDGWRGPLVDLADEYNSDFNVNGSRELKAGLESIGLPYFRSKNDDELPSAVKKEDMQRVRDNERLKDITKLYESGITVLDISIEYGVSCQSIGQLLRRHGVIGGYAERKAG